MGGGGVEREAASVFSEIGSFALIELRALNLLIMVYGFGK